MSLPKQATITLVIASLLTLAVDRLQAEAKKPNATGDQANELRTHRPAILTADALHKYVDTFNHHDRVCDGQAISNEAAADWMARNVPLFQCPDKDIEQVYHFRWWTFRKHIRQTPDGFVITEFLPDVRWSGKHNTISCPAGHHFREGRWICDPKYLDADDLYEVAPDHA
jgi:hypothetical protein